VGTRDRTCSPGGEVRPDVYSWREGRPCRESMSCPGYGTRLWSYPISTRYRAYRAIPGDNSVNLACSVLQKSVVGCVLHHMTEQIVNITTRQVAQIACVDDSTVRRWAENDELPGAWKTPGGHWRFDRRLIDARFQKQVAS